MADADNLEGTKKGKLSIYILQTITKASISYQENKYFYVIVNYSLFMQVFGKNVKIR